VRRIAVPGAIAQIVVATLLGALLAYTWDWSLAAGLMFGLSLSVASTVVLLRALVLIPAVAEVLGSPDTDAGSTVSLLKMLGVTLAKVVMFVVLALVVGARAVRQCSMEMHGSLNSWSKPASRGRACCWSPPRSRSSRGAWWKWPVLSIPGCRSLPARRAMWSRQLCWRRAPIMH
jgi:hypothetical protein